MDENNTIEDMLALHRAMGTRFICRDTEPLINRGLTEPLIMRAWTYYPGKGYLMRFKNVAGEFEIKHFVPMLPRLLRVVRVGEVVDDYPVQPIVGQTYQVMEQRANGQLILSQDGKDIPNRWDAWQFISKADEAKWLEWKAAQPKVETLQTPAAPAVDAITHRQTIMGFADTCGVTLTGKPDGSEPITVRFNLESWQKFIDGVELKDDKS